MNVLIVSRTKMEGQGRCFGGLTEYGKSVRLLTVTGSNFNTSAPFKIGEIWNIFFRPVLACLLIPPHVENVIVFNKRKVRSLTNISQHILGLATPWQGDGDALFDGLVRYTRNHSGYICKRIGVPATSTGFWIPNGDLVLRKDGKHYDFSSGRVCRGFAYVGEADPIARVCSGTLVRVSLARWWKPKDADPDFEKRCYVQISGWY